MSRERDLPMLLEGDQQEIQEAGKQLLDAVRTEKQKHWNNLPKKYRGKNFSDWDRNNSSSRELWLKVADTIPTVRAMREKFAFLFLYDWGEYGDDCHENKRLLVYPKSSEADVLEAIQQSAQETLQEGYPTADKNEHWTRSGESQREEVRNREAALLSRLRDVNVMDGGFFSDTFRLARNPENPFNTTETLSHEVAFQLADIMMNTTYGIHQILRTPNGSALPERIDTLLEGQDKHTKNGIILSQEIQEHRDQALLSERTYARTVQSVQPEGDKKAINIILSDDSPSMQVAYEGDLSVWTDIEAAQQLDKILKSLEVA